MSKGLPPIEDFLGNPVPDFPGYRITRHIGSGRRAHVFVARSESLAREVACKIIPSWNLVGADQVPPLWREEITNANLLSSARAVKVFTLGRWTTSHCECIYLISDLVHGLTLAEYLRTASVDIGFIESLLLELLDFLRELEAAKLQHGDLHAGNILIEDRRDALSGAPFAVRVTDFGVAPATSTTLLDDYDSVAQILRDLLARLDYAELVPTDRVMFNFLRDVFLGKRLLERDSTFDPRCRNPRGLADSLREARNNALTMVASESKRTLSTPFDYLSCEQIGEYHLLLKGLYSDKMLGLKDIEDVNNLVLTGPRGCGKTTVYRSLSLKHRALTDNADPDTVKYIGVYYRCDDLAFTFPRYRLPSQQEAWDIPVHFLTATLLAELLEALSLWLPRHYGDEWQHVEASCARSLWSLLDLTSPISPGANSFTAIVRALRGQRERAARDQRVVDSARLSSRRLFGPSVLATACTALAQHFTALGVRPIFFLVDDYSLPKVSSDLQRNLNRLLMQRSASCFFKLATESPASYENRDVDDKSYVEGREYKLVNLGIDFINADATDRLRFIDDIFARRLASAADFPVKGLDALVGDDSESDNNNAVALRLRDNKKWTVWGRRSLGEICSGDVHFLIELVGKMVSLQGGPKELRNTPGQPAIPPDIQNQAIRTEAGNFLKNLRALPRGQELVEIVSAFGAVAHSYLRLRNSKNEGNSPPHQASRIEPFEDPKLDSDTRLIYTELLRYSVFIEDVRGKSRRGLVVPRLYLRRFLIPHFGLTFSKRDSLSLSVEQLRQLLTSPKDFEARMRLKEPDLDVSAETDPSIKIQLPLPGTGKN